MTGMFDSVIYESVLGKFFVNFQDGIFCREVISHFALILIGEVEAKDFSGRQENKWRNFGLKKMKR